MNNFRFGYLSANAPEGSAAPPSSLATDLAETGIFTKFGPLQETWPNVGMTGYSSGGGPVNSYSGSYIPEWEFADSFTSVHGKHTLGFGIDYRYWTITRNLDDDFYGDWGFSSSTDSVPTARQSRPPTPHPVAPLPPANAAPATPSPT